MLFLSISKEASLPHINETDIPEGCLFCNPEEVSKIIIQHGVNPDSLSLCIPEVLEENQEIVGPCGVCGVTFVIDWSKSNVVN